MAKREWYWTHDASTNEANDPLWAIVERLEALVAIGDQIEEVYDVLANHLTFGGQPVGDLRGHEWQCDRTETCTLYKGHGGDCVHVIGAEQEDTHGPKR